MKIKLLVLVLILLIAGCGSNSGKYKEGDKVRIKLDGRVGILVRECLETNHWEVKFSCDAIVEEVDKGVFSDTVTNKRVL